MSQPLVWVHGDRLSPANEALRAHPDAPTVFVFDDVVLSGFGVSLARIQFIYECLLEMPVEIYRGDPVTVLTDLAKTFGADRIVTTWTPAPRFHHLVKQLMTGLTVEILQPDPFLTQPHAPDLTRFSRFWNEVRSDVLTPYGLPKPLPLPGIDPG